MIVYLIPGWAVYHKHLDLGHFHPDRWKKIKFSKNKQNTTIENLMLHIMNMIIVSSVEQL